MNQRTFACINAVLFTAILLTIGSNRASGQEQQNRSWADRLEYVGVAVSEPDYHVWGSSPVVGSDGKTHLFVARWPIKDQFKAWNTHSEIARYVSESPTGPFVFQEVVVKGSGKTGDWDCQAAHNPNVQKIGDKYVLTYIANNGDPKKSKRIASQRIGMMIADRIEGPWKEAGSGGLILSPPTDPAIWSFRSTVGVNNPALIQHPDGRFFLYYKALKKGGVRRMGVAIADQVEGPYRFTPKPLTSNSTTIEDGYAFVEQGEICLITTNNDEGAGYLWKSKDGVQFSDPILGYDKLHRYLSKQKLAKAKVPRGKKFERPQVLAQADNPTYLYVASGTNWNNGKGSYSCVLRIRPQQEQPQQEQLQAEQ